MSDVTPSSANAYDHAAIAEALDNITAGLERVLASFNNLKTLLLPEDVTDTSEFDPKDPANKKEVGGLMKLTHRGMEICYRLFDAGKTRYAVATAMDISFGAANHRYEAWKKLGGVNRTRQLLD
jgi:DNA-binding NarL/FixJ family response regulator